MALLAGAVFFSSCKKNNVSVDVDPMDVPLKSQIAYYGPLGGSADAKNFYVGNTPAEAVFKIPVGLTKPSSTPTTLQISFPTITGVDAVQGTHFTAPTSITIPAGQVVDSLTITGIASALPTGTSRLMLVKITGGDVGTVYQKDSVFVKLQQYCTPSVAAIQGNYTNTIEYTSTGAVSWGPYTAALTNVVATSATTATAKLVNIYDDGWVDLDVTLDWTGRANKITIPLQTTGKSYAGGVPTHVRTSTAAGAVHSFNSCDRSVSFSIDLVNSATGAVLASNYKVVMK